MDRPFAQGADGIKIISTKKKISVDFLFQYLCNSPIIFNSYKRHFSELKEKIILFPDLDSGEQEKISRFLFSIDILIKKEKNKITELKQHKKASSRAGWYWFAFAWDAYAFLQAACARQRGTDGNSQGFCGIVFQRPAAVCNRIPGAASKDP